MSATPSKKPIKFEINGSSSAAAPVPQTKVPTARPRQPMRFELNGMAGAGTPQPQTLTPQTQTARQPLRFELNGSTQAQAPVPPTLPGAQGQNLLSTTRSFAQASPTLQELRARIAQAGPTQPSRLAQDIQRIANPGAAAQTMAMAPQPSEGQR